MPGRTQRPGKQVERQEHRLEVGAAGVAALQLGRFGGGPTEKESHDHLAGGLPYGNLTKG